MEMSMENNARLIRSNRRIVERGLCVKKKSLLPDVFYESDDAENHEDPEKENGQWSESGTKAHHV